MTKQIAVRVFSTSPAQTPRAFGLRVKTQLKKQGLKGSFDFIFKSPHEVTCREWRRGNAARFFDFGTESITIRYFEQALSSSKSAANANTIVDENFLSGENIPKLIRGRMMKLHHCVNTALGKKQAPVLLDP